MSNGNASNSRTNLIINYIPQGLSDTEFRSMFENIGAVRGAKIIRNKMTGYSYGFGFVDFANANDAQRAIDQLNGVELQGKRLKVALARPPGQGTKNANVYIRGIPKEYSIDELEAMFSEYGPIIQFRALKDDTTNLNKGVAFALYEDKESADRAIANLNGVTLTGGVEALTVKFAEDNSKKMPRGMIPMGPSGVGGFGNLNISPITPINRGNGGPMFRPPNRMNRFNPISGNNTYGGGMGDMMANNFSSNPAEEPTLFVYNIGNDTDEKSMWNLFSQYGVVRKVNVMQDPQSGKGKGFCFVTMGSYDAAQWAIQCLNGFYYAGKPLQVSFKAQKNQQQPGFQIGGGNVSLMSGFSSSNY